MGSVTADSLGGEEESGVDEFPWYAWIALAVILVAVVVQMARMARSRSQVAINDPELRARVISLEQRVERLERR